MESAGLPKGVFCMSIRIGALAGIFDPLAGGMTVLFSDRGSSMPEAGRAP